ncbi:MAG: ferrochelatase [Propioniciclava sp.]
MTTDVEVSRTPLIVLVNLGTPEAPTSPAVRRFLREFLSDRRVIGLPRAVWLPVLNGIILAVRPRRSARLYSSIWEESGSPLMTQSESLTQLVDAELGEAAEARLAMTYGRPSVAEVLDQAVVEDPQRPILVLPLYPQYAGSSSGAVHDAVCRWGLSTVPHPDLRLLPSFPSDPGYLDAVAAGIRAHWEAVGPLDPDAGERLILSYHGIPVSHVRAGDPYPDECAATTRGLVDRLDVDPAAILTTYQSKFGPGAWLTPATIDTVAELGARRTPRVDMVAPGFAVDCLETLEELNKLNRHTFTDAGGGDFHYIAWSRENSTWVRALATLLIGQVRGESPIALP